MKSNEEKIEIKKTMVIDSSPSVVFRAITETNELTKWFPDHVIFEPKVNVAPVFPSELFSAQILPPCASTIFFEI